MPYVLHMRTHHHTPDGEDTAVSVSEVFDGDCPYIAGDEVSYGGATWTVTKLYADDTIVMCERGADILGVHEMADLAGVLPRTMSAYVSRGQCPKPDWILKCGPIWRNETALAWITTRNARDRRPGPPRSHDPQT